MAWMVAVRSWAPAVGVLLVATGLTGACAKGIEGDDGAGASSSASSSGSTGTGGAGGASASSSDASSSSTGTPCDEQPCKLVSPQCGCALDEKCTLDTMGERVCQPDGTVAIGEQCGNCAAGSQCLNTLGQSLCREYCASDAECNGPGGICALQVNDGMGGTWDDKFCSENCDPVSSTGCGPANAKCELGQEQDGMMRFFTLCTGSGPGTQGSACTDTGDCAKGYGCFNATTLQCLRWCTPNNGPVCPGVTDCLNFDPPILVGSLEYGACL